MGSSILGSIMHKDWNPQEIYDLFSKKIPEMQEVIQGKTGYCWLISALHAIACQMTQKYPDAKVCFDVEYLIFYDKLEKANWFLEKILERLNVAEDNRDLLYLLSHAMTDQGQWHMAENLVCKYGLVPAKWNETQLVLKPTGELNASLAFLLRYKAARIREMYQNGADDKELRQFKNQVMKKVESMLISFFGNQPIMVNVPEYCVKGGQKLTPLEFYNCFVQFPFADYVCIIQDSNKPECTWTEDIIELDGNIVSGRRNTFLHVTQDVFRKAVFEQVRSGQPCWIGCDSGKFQFPEYGIFDDTAFDLFEILGKDFDEKITREEIFRYKIASASHAMLLVDFVKKDNKILWWRAKNSMENLQTGDGMFFLSNSWVNKYVFYAVVKKDYIPQEINKRKRVVKPWELFMMA